MGSGLLWRLLPEGAASDWGDHWLIKYGPKRIVRTGGIFAGTTFGISIAIAVPLSAHAQIPAIIIICISFAAYFIGPTLTGGVSQLTSLPIALYISVTLLFFAGFQGRILSEH